MTIKAVFALNELISDQKTDNKVVNKTSKTPNVIRSVGINRIQKEKSELAADGNPSSPNYIIASALSVMEMSIYDPQPLESQSIPAALQFLLESFQLDLIDLIEKQHLENGDVVQSRQFLQEKSKQHEVRKVGIIPTPSIADAFLLKPYMQSKDFRHKANLLDDHSSQAKAIGQKLVKELKKPRFLHFRETHFSQRLLSPSYDFLTITNDEIKHHIAVIERDAAICTLETQIDRFYAWKKSDRYKQMLRAYSHEIRQEQRLQKHFQPK
jgi:hypothetical protein